MAALESAGVDNHYLEQRFAITDFDAASKAQGAAGAGIEATTADGRRRA